MKLYVVRYVKAKRIIGLFWCKNLAKLAMLVDNETDLANAEYAIVDEAAVIRWGSRGPAVGVHVPYDFADEKDSNAYYRRLGHGIFFTDALQDFFGGEVPDSRWKRLPALDQD